MSSQISFDDLINVWKKDAPDPVLVDMVMNILVLNTKISYSIAHIVNMNNRILKGLLIRDKVVADTEAEERLKETLKASEQVQNILNNVVKKDIPEVPSSQAVIDDWGITDEEDNDDDFDGPDDIGD